MTRQRTMPYKVTRRDSKSAVRSTNNIFDAECLLCDFTSSGWYSATLARQSVQNHVRKIHFDAVNW